MGTRSKNLFKAIIEADEEERQKLAEKLKN
jgi:hypothetical protein